MTTSLVEDSHSDSYYLDKALYRILESSNKCIFASFLCTSFAVCNIINIYIYHTNMDNNTYLWNNIIIGEIVFFTLYGIGACGFLAKVCNKYKIKNEFICTKVFTIIVNCIGKYYITRWMDDNKFGTLGFIWIFYLQSFGTIGVFINSICDNNNDTNLIEPFIDMVCWCVCSAMFILKVNYNFDINYYYIVLPFIFLQASKISGLVINYFDNKTFFCDVFSLQILVNTTFISMYIGGIISSVVALIPVYTSNIMLFFVGIIVLLGGLNLKSNGY